jgi:thymidine phosphorylase
VDDVVDPTVGMVISARPGTRVQKGEPLASIYAKDEAGVAMAKQALQASIVIGDGQPQVPPLVAARVSAKGYEALS